jgi:cytochrome c-type biogenesis protein CcmF
MALMGVSLGVWVLVAVLVELAGRVDLFRSSVATSARRAVGLPGSAWGMSFAHAGIGLVVLGITASVSWEREVITMMQPGETQTLGAYEMTLTSVAPGSGPNYSYVRGVFEVREEGRFIARLTPEIRTFTDPPTQTTEAAIYPLITGDIYAVISDAGPNARPGLWAVRLYHKPLISWLWAGGLLMVLGGVFSLADRRLRLGVAARAGRRKSIEQEATA